MHQQTGRTNNSKLPPISSQDKVTQERTGSNVPMPSGPWSHLSIRFLHPSTYEEFFVVIDDYSRYPEIHRVGPHRLARYDTVLLSNNKRLKHKMATAYFS
jgi:ribosomal protein L32E